MREDLINRINWYKDAIIAYSKVSSEEKSEEEIEEEICDVFNTIKNLLGNSFENDYIQIITDIKVKLRYELLQECQRLMYQIRTFGLDNIDYNTNDEFKRIAMMNHIIELCSNEIKELKEPPTIAENENAIYIFMDSALNDLGSLPDEYALEFDKIIKRMSSDKYAGREDKCKVMKGSKLENSLEHRGYNGARLYENRVRTSNSKVNKIIENLERELGKTIHFVYKLEIKKCTSANGLDDKRIQRYKNERKKIIEILSGMSSSGVLKFALEQKEGSKRKKSKEGIDNILERKVKRTNNKKRYKVIGFDIMKDYLHATYDSGIFSGYIDPKISKTEISADKAIETESYETFRRLVSYLQTLELEKLQKLSMIFEEVSSEFSVDEIPVEWPKNKKNALIRNEINRIILVVISMLRGIYLEEAKTTILDRIMETEREILMLMDFEEEYNFVDRKEKQYG